MTQISRPFQIALAVLVLFVAVWFVALRGHSSSSSGAAATTPVVSSSASSSSPSSSASAANSSTASSSTPSSGSKAAEHKAHHAAAPSAAGLKRAIVKAQGAVTHSQHKAGATNAAKAAPKTAPSKTAKTHAASPTKASVTSANTQKAVEVELKQGKVVALLFWNPKGTVDGVVRRELQAVSHSSHGGVVVHVARSNEIGSFGSFTRTEQVYSTPTIVLINKTGKASSLTGLADAFGIEQAVREVKHAK